MRFHGMDTLSWRSQPFEMFCPPFQGAYSKRKDLISSRVVPFQKSQKMYLFWKTMAETIPNVFCPLKRFTKKVQVCMLAYRSHDSSKLSYYFKDVHLTSSASTDKKTYDVKGPNGICEQWMSRWACTFMYSDLDVLCSSPYTVEIQWLEHHWVHGNLFEIWVVWATEG